MSVCTTDIHTYYVNIKTCTYYMYVCVYYTLGIQHSVQYAETQTKPHTQS